MGSYVTNWTQPGYRSVIKPAWWNFQSATVAASFAGRVYLSYFELPFPAKVISLTWFNYATVAGNVTVGVYGAGSGGEVDGGALLATSASVAQAGANSYQTLAITSPTTLPAGKYWAAFTFSDATATYGRLGVAPAISTWLRSYDQAYGAFQDPCPATAAVTTTTPCFAALVEP